MKSEGLCISVRCRQCSAYELGWVYRNSVSFPVNPTVHNKVSALVYSLLIVHGGHRALNKANMTIQSVKIQNLQPTWVAFPRRDI